MKKEGQSLFYRNFPIKEGQSLFFAARSEKRDCPSFRGVAR